MAKDTIRNRKLLEEFHSSIHENSKLKNFGQCNVWVSESVSIMRGVIEFTQAVNANEYLFSLPAHTYIAQGNVPVLTTTGSVIAFSIDATGNVSAVNSIASGVRCFISIPIFIVD